MARLLMVSTYPLTIQTFLLPYARHFRSKGWKVDALASGDMRPVADAFDRTHSIAWSQNPLNPGTLLSAPRALRDLVAREEYDLVHVHTSVAAFVTRLALRDRRDRRADGAPKVIYTTHGLPFRDGGTTVKNVLFKALEKLAGKWTDYLVVMNVEDAAAARKLRLVPEPSLKVMPGIGLDLATYSTSTSGTELASTKCGLRPSPGSDPYLLCVAEFRPVKRHQDVLEAFAKISSDPPLARVKLLLAGSGPLLAKTRLLASRLGIADRVQFLGFRDDIPALLRGATALVLASDFEGLPRSILEAMVAKTPVIGTRVRGITDLLGSDLGLLVPPRDPSALARAMRYVLSNPDAARERAARAARAVHQFALEKLILLHEQLYAEALSGEAIPVAVLTA